MKFNHYSKAALITLSVCVMFFACEDFADETFELTAIDAAAISAMEDTLEVALQMKAANILNNGSDLGVVLSGGGLDTVLMTVDTLGLTPVDVYSALTSAGISSMTSNDTVFAVTILSDSLAYRVFTAPSAGIYVLYINRHLTPNLYLNGTTKVELLSDDMAPELIAGLYNLPGPVPVIKGRYEYELTPGDYLFELARMEATTANNFRFVFTRE